MSGAAVQMLIRVTTDEDMAACDLAHCLMGEKPELRFQYVGENARIVEGLDV